MDEHRAKATISINGTIGSGIFFFDKDGRFEKFETLRYKDVTPDAERLPWTIIATKTEEKNGVVIPTELNVSWTLEDQTWTWLELKIKDIAYAAIPPSIED